MEDYGGKPKMVDQRCKPKMVDQRGKPKMVDQPGKPKMVDQRRRLKMADQRGKQGINRCIYYPNRVYLGRDLPRDVLDQHKEVGLHYHVRPPLHEEECRPLKYEFKIYNYVYIYI